MSAKTVLLRVVIQPKWSVLSNSVRTDLDTEILEMYVESLDDIILLLFPSPSVRPSLIYFTKNVTSLLTLFFFLNDIAVDDVSHGNDFFRIRRKDHLHSSSLHGTAKTNVWN